MKKIPRVAFFPDSYLEVNGAAMTCRRLVGFAEDRGYPFLCVYADRKTQQSLSGSVINLALKRSPVAIPMDEGLKYDPLFNRHLKRVGRLLDDFKPDILHLTGLNDVSIIAAILAYQKQITLIGSWHTNIHEFASRRLRKMLRFMPEGVRNPVSQFAENKIFEGAAFYYKMPEVFLAPNQELIDGIEKRTNRKGYLMERGVDNKNFSPSKRTVNDDVFRFGFVGRLRAEKNVRMLVKLEKRLLELGKTNFRFLIVGEGNERSMLENNMRNADFLGFVEGETLAEAYANMDLFLFPSETDTFGNVIQEAMASGVPSIVTDKGGPKFIVKDDETGFVAEDFEKFVEYAVKLMDNPGKLAKMKKASVDWVKTKSWDAVFDGVYEAYSNAIDSKERRRKV